MQHARTEGRHRYSEQKPDATRAPTRRCRDIPGKGAVSKLMSVSKDRRDPKVTLLPFHAEYRSSDHRTATNNRTAKREHGECMQNSTAPQIWIPVCLPQTAVRTEAEFRAWTGLLNLELTTQTTSLAGGLTHVVAFGVAEPWNCLHAEQQIYLWNALTMAPADPLRAVSRDNEKYKLQRPSTVDNGSNMKRLLSGKSRTSSDWRTQIAAADSFVVAHVKPFNNATEVPAAAQGVSACIS